MSPSWVERKNVLSSLLQCRNDDDEGMALDRLLHGQNTIGKTSRTIQVDSLRFSDKDLVPLGTLDRGQFGVIDLVNCVFNRRAYVRKSIERVVALRSREQCSPQIERDVLLLAKRTNTVWAPHLLCSFQTATHLNLVMDYAEGGTLWDVLESSPLGGRVSEADVEWWAPQAVCAISWCHSQGFAHRDIKPHNFVLTSTSRLQLIDFGSAAPLSPPGPDGSQNIPQRHSLVPCGTCDYISPEILQAHEDALLALELSDESPVSPGSDRQASTCGLETDWWSLGVMLYELLYGATPFFANDIRTTYLRIMDHETSLRFDKSISVSESCRDLLQGLLTSREYRLGRRNVLEITEHPFFKFTPWASVGMNDPPPELHMPQFVYTAPTTDAFCASPDSPDESDLQPFHFSALFQSSVSTSPGWPALPSNSRVSHESRSPQAKASFIGFSWGPSKDAFRLPGESMSERALEVLKTPRPLLHVESSPYAPRGPSEVPSGHPDGFTTPIRPHNVTLYHTIPRMGTTGRTPMRRTVSDREAMRQLLDCIGMSARKKVLASGRKPRMLDSINRSRSVAIRKELRFGPPPVVTRTSGASTDFPPVPSASESEATETESEGPPSPSPRPGSAMSSRRSTTPTITASHSTRFLSLSLPTPLPPGTYREPDCRAEGGDRDDGAFTRMEDRLAALVLRLYRMQAEVDRVKELVES